MPDSRDDETDGFFFAGDRLFVVTDLQEAMLAMRGGANGEDKTEVGGDTGEPVGVICYRLPAELAAAP